MTVEIEHVATPDGEECGHVAVGENEQKAEMLHLLHCLQDHDLEDEVAKEVRRRLEYEHDYDL